MVKANSSANLAKSAVWKLLHYDHQLNVSDPHLMEEAAAFRSWRAMCNEEVLSSTGWVDSFMQVTTRAAANTEDQAARAATKRFVEWIAGG